MKEKETLQDGELRQVSGGAGTLLDPSQQEERCPFSPNLRHQWETAPDGTRTCRWCGRNVFIAG